MNNWAVNLLFFSPCKGLMEAMLLKLLKVFYICRMLAEPSLKLIYYWNEPQKYYAEAPEPCPGTKGQISSLFMVLL